MTPALAAAQDRAHLVVTRLMHGERDAVASEMVDLAKDDPMEVLYVALVLADLACWLHHRYSDFLHIDSDARDELWGRMLVEVAAWREVGQ